MPESATSSAPAASVSPQAVTLSESPVVVVGAGPAGLTAALELVRAGRKVVVYESDPDHVGGIARTARFKEFRLDIGGHRFYTKIAEVEAMWKELLGDDFIEVTRRSRIYYHKRFLEYPLQAMDAFFKLGPWFSFRAVLSHFKRRLKPIQPEVSFRDWVTNRFGDKLFHTFFESYTEKVWGIKCTEISADWAAQRIQGLSVWGILVRTLIPGFLRGDKPGAKTLIDKFHYPRLGCGMMWEKAREAIEQACGRVEMGREVVAVHRSGGAVTSVEFEDAQGRRTTQPTSEVISSMPLRELVEALNPAPPTAILKAARQLRYRDFITVGLVVNREDCFPDNWIYIHDPEVRLGRIQNFKNWSAEMVPRPGVSFLGLEYFCFEGDGLWNMPDEKLIALGRREIRQIGLVKEGEVLEGTVIRMPKAYPIYDENYRDAVEMIRGYLTSIPNLKSAGRNAMHQYNNQDHSMMTALLAARNLCGTDDRDPWMVNHNAEYIEERLTPNPITPIDPST